MLFTPDRYYMQGFCTLNSAPIFQFEGYMFHFTEISHSMAGYIRGSLLLCTVWFYVRKKCI